jgi:hypothetical protein
VRVPLSIGFVARTRALPGPEGVPAGALVAKAEKPATRAGGKAKAGAA